MKELPLWVMAVSSMIGMRRKRGMEVYLDEEFKSLDVKHLNRRRLRKRSQPMIKLLIKLLSVPSAHNTQINFFPSLHTDPAVLVTVVSGFQTPPTC